MSQRKIVFAGLPLIVVALAIWLRPGNSVRQNEVHSPLVITNFYCPGEDEKPGWVKRRWRQFAENWGEEKAYGQYIEAEASGIDDTLGRLETLYTMGNKGVHENWDPKMFRGVVLRIVLLINDLISFNPGKRSLKYDRSFFTQIFHDND